MGRERREKKTETEADVYIGIQIYIYISTYIYNTWQFPETKQSPERPQEPMMFHDPPFELRTINLSLGLSVNSSGTNPCMLTTPRNPCKDCGLGFSDLGFRV